MFWYAQLCTPFWVKALANIHFPNELENQPYFLSKHTENRYSKIEISIYVLESLSNFFIEMDIRFSVLQWKLYPITYLIPIRFHIFNKIGERRHIIAIWSFQLSVQTSHISELWDTQTSSFRSFSSSNSIEPSKIIKRRIAGKRGVLRTD